jgi:predicted aspartyl protease
MLLFFTLALCATLASPLSIPASSESSTSTPHQVKHSSFITALDTETASTTTEAAATTTDQFIASSIPANPDHNEDNKAATVCVDYTIDGHYYARTHENCQRNGMMVATLSVL